MSHLSVWLGMHRYTTAAMVYWHPASGGASCTMATLHPSSWMGVTPNGLRRADPQTWQSPARSRQALISSNGIQAARLLNSQRPRTKNLLYCLMLSCSHSGYTALNALPVRTVHPTSNHQPLVSIPMVTVCRIYASLVCRLVQSRYLTSVYVCCQRSECEAVSVM